MPQTRYSVSRANARFSFMAEAEIAEVGSAKGFIARVSELSSHGCYVDTVNPLPEGTELSMSIRYGCSACTFKGSVLYTHPGFGMGVRFGETTPANRATLHAWLDELARKSS
jgi:PilZ domain